MGTYLVRASLLWALVMGGMGLGYAQAHRALPDVLDSLAAQEQVAFNYDPALLGYFSAPAVPPGASLSEYLQRVETALPFRIEEVEEGIYTIAPRPVTLTLRLVDATTGEPLPGVNVRTQNKIFSTTTTMEGSLSLKWDWSPRDTLIFSYVGYQRYEIAFPALLATGLEPTIALSDQATMLSPLVIRGYLGQGISAQQMNHSLLIEHGELGILPGDVDKDVLMSLRNLPGIQSTTGRAGELRVRGGTPDQTLVLFNNIPIFHKGYFFGTISPFNTDVVDRIRVFRSGYGPRLGGRVGGAIEMESDPTVPKGLQMGMATNTLAVSGYVKAPAAKGKLGVALAARTKHPGDFRFPIEDQYEQLVLAGTALELRSENPNVVLEPFDIEFWDANGTLTLNASENTQLGLNFITINNTNDIVFADERANERTTRIHELENHGINARWDQQWAGWKGSSQASWTSYAFVTKETALNQSTQQTRVVTDHENDLEAWHINTRWEHAGWAEDDAIAVGYEYVKMEGVTAVFDSVPFRASDPGESHNLFLHYSHPTLGRWMIDAGVRASRITHLQRTRIEPRLFINFLPTDRLTFKLSGGSYSQWVTRNVFFDNNELPPEKLTWHVITGKRGELITSWQGLFGFSYQSPHWLFDVDGYYKRVDRLTTQGVLDPQSGRGGLLGGWLQTQGMDALIRTSQGPWDAWANYTLSRTVMAFKELVIGEFPANYDQRHLVNLALAWHQGPWRASLGWYFASGVPDYSDRPIFPAIGTQLRELPEPRILGEVERFGAMHQLDGSVAYVLRTGSVRTTFGISLLNIYNRDNLLERVRYALPNQPPPPPPPGSGNPPPPPPAMFANRFTIGFAPNAMIKIEFGR